MSESSSSIDSPPKGYDEKLSILQDFLVQQGLRNTHQREVILAEFLRQHRHFTIEELCEEVKKVDSTIGYATVYRTLRLFTECGIASKHDFGSGSARFERESGHHHDHMICTKCSKIIEFENDEIERLQDEVCAEHKFRLTSHRMEMYGLCENCQ